MSSHCDWFLAYRPLENPIKVWLGDNSYILGQGVGRISLQTPVDGTKQHVILEDVLYIPELYGNLLSVSAFAKRGARIHFFDSKCEVVTKADQTICVSL